MTQPRRRSVRDELLRAAVYADADAATIVRVHAIAPLVEYAIELQEAVESEAVLGARVSERFEAFARGLVDELHLARRRAILAEAALVAMKAEVT